MGRDRNKTNQDLKNKPVLNRHEKKPLGNQPYFCVTAEPSIGNIVSLVFKQILRKERTGIFATEWRGFLNCCFSVLFYIYPFGFGSCYGVSLAPVAGISPKCKTLFSYHIPVVSFWSSLQMPGYFIYLCQNKIQAQKYKPKLLKRFFRYSLRRG